jgi:predicted TIM-barrel fold metal-dependent hydrolase
VVDTHLHCFAGKDDARFPYHERAPYKPDAAATPEQLLRCMDGAGVDYAVVVHPEPYQDDHRYLEHCLAVGRGRLKGTCLFFADLPGSVARMAPLVKRLPVVAARVHAYRAERLPPFGKPELRELWKQAADLGIAVQIHFEPRWAGGYEPYLQEFSSTPVVVDHLGRPFQGTPEEHARVVGWGAKFKNTVMKLSAIPPQTQYPHGDIRPVIRALADAYGPDRMIWGGGFGADATPESYRADRERARSFIAHLSPADQAKVLGGTAAKLYRFI